MQLIRKYSKFMEWSVRFAYLILGFLTFQSFLYETPIQPFFVKLCLVLGILTIIGRLFSIKNYLKMPYIVVLTLFCVSFGITIIMNWSYGVGILDLKWLIWTGILFFLLYVCDTTRDTKEYKKEFEIFADIIIVLSTISAIISLYLMCIHYHNLWITENGETLIAGFQWGRLWGVYTDPNYGGVFSVISILLCIYFIRQRKNIWKIWYLCSAILAFAYIIFSDSRTAYISMYFGMGILIFIFCIYRYKVWKGISVAVLCMAILIVGSMGISLGAKSLYLSNVKTHEENKVVTSSVKQENKAPKNIAPKKKVENVDEFEERKQDIKKDVSNGRFSLWESGLEVWKTKPIVGTGYNSFLPYVKEHLPNTYVVNNPQGNYMSLHNGYLNILVYQGIIGAGCFLFFMLGVIYSWCKGIRVVPKEDLFYIAVLTGCICVVAVSMIFLLEGVYTNSPSAFVLWTFLGYLLQYFIRRKDVGNI